MKIFVLSFANWAQKNWLALVIFLTLVWMFFLVAVVCSWLFGFWLNGLYGYKFELSSAWTGVGAIAAAFAAILSLSKTSWTKWQTDSDKNSEETKQPDWSLK